MIECFFDDSGSAGDKTEKFVCIAGYIGHDYMWAGFNAEWQHLLLKHGLPYIHMKEMKGIFQRRQWDSVKQKEVMEDFVGVIKRQQLIGLGIALDAEVWRGLSKERRKGFGNEQEFCFQRILRRIMDRMRLANQIEPLGIVFDRDWQFARPRLSLIEHITKQQDQDLNKAIAALSFADSERYYPLQAADMLAWETRRDLINRANGKDSRESFKELLSGLPEYAGEFWDQVKVDEYFLAIESANGLPSAQPSS